MIIKKISDNNYYVRDHCEECDKLIEHFNVEKYDLEYFTDCPHHEAICEDCYSKYQSKIEYEGWVNSQKCLI